MFENRVAVITGGAKGIGRCIADEFRKNGAEVAVIDKAPGDHFVGDVGDKTVLEEFAAYVVQKYGRIDYLINNALPLMRGINKCSYEEFQYALAVSLVGKVRVNSISPGWILPSVPMRDLTRRSSLPEG